MNLGIRYNDMYICAKLWKSRSAVMEGGVGGETGREGGRERVMISTVPTVAVHYSRDASCVLQSVNVLCVVSQQLSSLLQSYKKMIQSN